MGAMIRGSRHVTIRNSMAKRKRKLSVVRNSLPEWDTSRNSITKNDFQKGGSLYCSSRSGRGQPKRPGREALHFSGQKKKEKNRVWVSRTTPRKQISMM